jgi:hypothetical protein
MSEIVQQVKSGLDKSTSAMLAGQSAETLYFDNQGALLQSSTGSIYNVLVSVPVRPSNGIFISGTTTALQLYQVGLTVNFMPGGASSAISSAKSSILITPID